MRGLNRGLNSLGVGFVGIAFLVVTYIYYTIFGEKLQVLVLIRNSYGCFFMYKVGLWLVWWLRWTKGWKWGKVEDM